MRESVADCDAINVLALDWESLELCQAGQDSEAVQSSAVQPCVSLYLVGELGQTRDAHTYPFCSHGFGRGVSLSSMAYNGPLSAWMKDLLVPLGWNEGRREEKRGKVGNIAGVGTKSPSLPNYRC